jgi:poly(A) polymerase
MAVMQKPRLHHDWIDSHAYGIVKALQKGGFPTYLVGGCVRDLLLGIHPKDFDIATAAHPPQVKRLIYMAFIIGKRFRLVLVKREDQQFEVATFRREVKAEEFPEGVPAGDNVFGSPEEDAQRRDFTVNGLFYDPVNDQLIDYVDGIADIQARILRMIGDPDVRLVEDSIRILRGLRLAHKLGLMIETNLRAAMGRNAATLAASALPRRREEILKILRLDEPELVLMECFDLGILEHVMPTLHGFISHPERREQFLQHFAMYRHIVTDLSDTTQLFGWLVYSMLQAALSGPSEREEPVTIDDEPFQRLMRDELGMFKYEQSALMKAIELVPFLSKTEEFKRRGERRQLALMKNEGFKLGLRLAEVDLQITPSQFAFWSGAAGKMSTELSEIAEAAKGKKRRRPRRKRGGGGRGEGGAGATSTDGAAGSDHEEGADDEEVDEADLSIAAQLALVPDDEP